MANLNFTRELLEGILIRIPEGFIQRHVLNQRVKVYKKSAVDKIIENSFAQRDGNIFFDSTRLTAQEARSANEWCRPILPGMSDDGTIFGAAITDGMTVRRQLLQDMNDPALNRLVDQFNQSRGYLHVDEINLDPSTSTPLQSVLEQYMFRQFDEFIYDSLRISLNTMREVFRLHELQPRVIELREVLHGREGKTAPHSELAEQFGRNTLSDILSLGGFTGFSISIKKRPYSSTWIRLTESNHEQAVKVAENAVSIKDSEWEHILAQCGDETRSGESAATTKREQVIARTYTIPAAAKALKVHRQTIERAIQNNLITALEDPEEQLRIPVAGINSIKHDPLRVEQICDLEIIKPRQLSVVCGVTYPAIRKWQKQENLDQTDLTWGLVKNNWDLPATLGEFRRAYKRQQAEDRAKRKAERLEEKRRIKAERDRIRQEREMLRAKLVAAFPTWKHEGRIEQQISLHIGPPNSGKTHDALITLERAGRGWYLAPLRLLAFEIFDRLNARGVLCNLLTGEEYIEIPGAEITAATIEMFNPQQSGECIIIDEAQMLADADRGWAWTRALMEAQAPDIHIIAPTTAQQLIERMASAAAIPLKTTVHERLTPIKVASKPWTLKTLPDHTILVAFSRRMVLELKTRLEAMQRTVSVVYGSLPPEVRRKQADRFASGATEICVATDAVGMGLNLPADCVCFYEIEKYDGAEVRLLNPSEVQQIGGRAGRYGLSESGIIGSTNRQKLKRLNQLYYTEPAILTHARVTPSVQDLELLPGNLAERLTQWASLESIPESLKGAIKTANLTERIELAQRLTDEEVEYLGLESSLQLVNAPTRRNTRDYWRECTDAIISRKPMPLPPQAPATIKDSNDLEDFETCIACADIYLWLGNRREFSLFAIQEPYVREIRADWSNRIDTALLHKIGMVKRCSQCRTSLPLNYTYNICQKCYRAQVHSGAR